ncbi:putative methyltransferase [Clostridiaceae bacterium JG1575]|nr:putative methyltransferase [Clostridiaceae bacterium JG1575]
MLNRFLQNTRKPKGFLGRFMLRGMNKGHAALSQWAVSYLPLKKEARILDVGCGGGANVAALLTKVPEGGVDGLDYSAESVAWSRKVNAKNLGPRCTITQGDVAHLPYSDHSLDVVTAFETIYFWPDLTAAFREIQRVLKPGGTFFICCESQDSTDTTWTDRIQGMTVYRGDDLKERLEALGFHNVSQHHHPKGWFALTATR